MQLRYQKLVEVVIRHDYYLQSVDSAGDSNWAKDYTIWEDLAFLPTPECQMLLRNYKLIFKLTLTGFNLFIAVDPTKPNQSLRFIDAKAKFTFLIQVKNPHFFNFTNTPLIESQKNLFYFNNRVNNEVGTKQFLSQEMKVYSATTTYQYGDLIIHNNKVLEAIKNASSDPNLANASVNCGQPVSPNNASWCESLISDARYATAQDRLPWQGNRYEYAEPNTNPGGVVTFLLKDIDGQPVYLGNIRNTNLSQGQYEAPSDSAFPCHHQLDFSSIPSGKYTLDIQKGGVTTTKTFYYLNPLGVSSTFGVIELFAGITPVANYLFLDHTTTPGASLLQEKTYEIRFKNRTTIREYIKRDGTRRPEKPVAGLTRKFTGFKPTATTLLPDPEIGLIIPKRVNETDPNDANYKRIAAIISEIYLSE